MLPQGAHSGDIVNQAGFQGVLIMAGYSATPLAKKLGIKDGSKLFLSNAPKNYLHLRFRRQWHVNSHLVAVEVGVERCADQRMDLQCLALD